MEVSKWRDGLAVQLPQAVVDALDLKPGDDLEVVYAASGRIEIKKTPFKISGSSANAKAGLANSG